ncbi:MAG: urease accessory protein UreD, partial [Hyphomicrobiaceae bacterium]|nr:urease accessory protein UreD [Hyphomicrobiaceae bacterium]
DTFLVDGAVASILDCAATLGGARAVATLLWVAPDAAARLGEVRALVEGTPCAMGTSAWNGLMAVRAAAREGRELEAALAPVITRLTDRPLPRVWQC